MLQLSFFGGTGTVTGSKYLLRSGKASLLVDCGLFQGYKQYRLHNREPLPVSPDQIGAVVFTHAHIDHSGHFPLLARDGFKGKAWCTPATRAGSARATCVLMIDPQSPPCTPYRV